MKTIITSLTLACLALATVASAECRTGPGGRTICSNGHGAAVVAPPSAAAPHAAVVGQPAGQPAAAGYNAKTGTAWKAQTNQNGVTTTKGSNGGEAKTKNGMGVAKGPNGKTCVKGPNNKGCN